MTLFFPKTGLLPNKIGEIILADIGIFAGTYAWKTLNLKYTNPFSDRFRIPLTVIV